MWDLVLHSKVTLRSCATSLYINNVLVNARNTSIETKILSPSAATAPLHSFSVPSVYVHRNDDRFSMSPEQFILVILHIGIGRIRFLRIAFAWHLATSTSSSSIEVIQCCVPLSPSSAASTCLRYHHQQHRRPPPLATIVYNIDIENSNLTYSEGEIDSLY